MPAAARLFSSRAAVATTERNSAMVLKDYSLRRRQVVSEADRLLTFVRKDPSGCWIWTGHINERGYGAFGFRGKSWLAHRAAWTIFCGAIPRGACVLHRCDNPPCVNPEHLETGDYAKNMRDMAQRGRHSVGNRKGERHPRAKLTDTDAIEMHMMKRRGEALGTIAQRFAVTKSTACGILRGRRWQHVIDLLPKGD